MGSESPEAIDMRRYAITAAALGFFAMALVGWCSGRSPSCCALRAGVGAVALYVMVSLAGRMVVSIIVDAVIRGRAARMNARKDVGERRV
jgi:hypothetical protein